MDSGERDTTMGWIVERGILRWGGEWREGYYDGVDSGERDTTMGWRVERGILLVRW